MKKRILSAALAVVMVLALACTAFAAGSKSTFKRPSVIGTKDGNGDAIITTELSATALPADVAELCNAINAGTKTIQDIPGISVAGKTALTEVYEVRWESSADKHDGATFTLSYSGITGPVGAIHYSTVRSTWEYVDADSYDASAHTATFTLQDVSPMILIGDQNATAPNTGASVFSIFG